MKKTYMAPTVELMTSTPSTIIAISFPNPDRDGVRVSDTSADDDETFVKGGLFDTAINW